MLENIIFGNGGTIIIESERDRFWRQINDRLQKRGLAPASNGEIERVVNVRSFSRAIAIIMQMRAEPKSAGI